MKLIYLPLIAVVAIACAKASPVQLDETERPVCYHGNVEAAKNELSKMKYEPALQNLRIFPGHIDGAPLIYAEQWNEHGGVYQKYVLPPCS